jgi:hypothetical protein
LLAMLAKAQAACGEHKTLDLVASTRCISRFALGRRFGRY